MLAAPAQTRAQSQLPFLARQLRSSLPRLQFFPGGTCTWGGHLRRGKRLDVGRDLLEGTVCSKQVGTEGSLLVRQLFLEPLRLQKIKHPDDQQTPFRMLARIAPCSLMLLGAVTRAPAMQSPSTGSKQLSTRSRGKPRISTGRVRCKQSGPLAPRRPEEGVVRCRTSSDVWCPKWPASVKVVKGQLSGKLRVTVEEGARRGPSVLIAAARGVCGI
jgi:hypothetical protein